MFDYLLEIELTTPRFTARISDVEEVMISPKIITDSVLEIEHRDNVYRSKTAKCQDLDCSEFYTSAVTTGKVAQCGDCLPKRKKTTYTKPFGCPEWNLLSKYLYDATFVKPPRISNASTYQDYINWFTTVPGQQQLKQFLARSGYWLGLHPCNGKSWQCLVECNGGTVGGCWDSGTYGSANIGLVYQIGESSYQVYDPVQILLAGLTPPGGSFPLLSGNPLTGLTANAGNPSDEDYEGCGRPFTILEDARSCLVGTPKPKECGDVPYQPKEERNPNWANKAIEGDFGGKSIKSQGECYLTPTQSVIMNSWSLAGSLGGTLDVGRFDDPPLLIDQVIENCGACISKLVEEGVGPLCCQVSYGSITVRDAPIWNGTSWGPGGTTWNNFWDDSIPDGGFRNDNECTDPTIPSSCSWSSGCAGPEDGDLANGIGTIPCGFPSTNGCNSGESLVQIGHREILSCDGGIATAVPIFDSECKDCGGEGAGDAPYLLYMCPQSCSGDSNPFADAHRNSRSTQSGEIPPDAPGGADDPDGSSTDCGFAAGWRINLCNDVSQASCPEELKYKPTCCADIKNGINLEDVDGKIPQCGTVTFGNNKPPGGPLCDLDDED